MHARLWAVVLAACSWGFATADAASWKVTVRNPGPTLGETPILAPIDADIAPGVHRLVPDAGGGKRIFTQVLKEGDRRYLAAVLPALPANATLSYTLRTEPGTERGESWVGVEAAGADLTVTLSGSPWTVYRGGEAAKPYFYPVIGPTGAPFTRAYPMVKNIPGEAHDHPHQRSFWFTHGKVNGLDFWASDPLNGDKPSYGRIKETSRQIASGVVTGQIRTTDDWLDHNAQRVCRDERLARFYATKGARVIDFDITIHASDGPVTFGDTKEGMFGVRVASTLDVTRKLGGRITNAEGLHDEAAWGKASPWVDYTGPVEGKTVGVAILNHPGSFRYPTTWHVRTYGLFAANPFGWHDFGMGKSGEYVVPKGESIHFGYRVVLHEGDTASARVDHLFQAYAKPPVVEVKAD